ncbi:MAG: ferritin-like domain-containing protein [Planctomycetota bacterium]|jgi:rubrerythrin
MKLDTVEQILDFAIANEEQAAKFYTELADKVDQKHMKDVFLGFAEEEKGHKTKLLAIKGGKQVLFAHEQVLDLKIGDYLEDVSLSSDLDYQEALTVAMKAEKAAFRLYQDLASTTDDPALNEMLLGLAQEEAKHKLRFEIEYDDNVFKDN